MSNSEPTTCDPVNLLVTHGLSIPSLGMVGRDRRGASQGWRRRRKQSTPLLSLYLLRPPSSNCGFMLVLDSLLLWILTSCVCPHLSFAHTGYPPGQDRHPETLTLLLSMCKDGISVYVQGMGWQWSAQGLKNGIQATAHPGVLRHAQDSSHREARWQLQPSRGVKHINKQL